MEPQGIMPKQVHSESCLASALRRGVYLKTRRVLSNEDELEIFIEASKAYRNDFAIGSSMVVQKKWGIKPTIFLGWKNYVNYLRRQGVLKKLDVQHHHLNESFIKKKLKESKAVIVQVDKFYYEKKDIYQMVHIPHYVVLYKLDQSATIMDPWDGEEKVVSKEEFFQSIRSLGKLLICPKLIIVE